MTLICIPLKLITIIALENDDTSRVSIHLVTVYTYGAPEHAWIHLCRTHWWIMFVGSIEAKTNKFPLCDEVYTGQLVS